MKRSLSSRNMKVEVGIKDIFFMGSEMVLGNCIIKMEAHMRDLGKMAKFKVLANYTISLEILHTKVIGHKENSTGREK